MFIGRTDATVDTPILWPPDTKNQLMGKDPDAGKDRKQEEKELTEDEMVGQHHQLQKLAQTHVHQVREAIQPSHPLSSPFPPDFNLSQHQSIFQ